MQRKLSSLWVLYGDTIEETIDYLTAAGEKVGVVKVRLYRPFCAQALIDAIPDTVKYINVL